jgi:hypothetical protein
MLTLSSAAVGKKKRAVPSTASAFACLVAKHTCEAIRLRRGSFGQTWLWRVGAVDDRVDRQPQATVSRVPLIDAVSAFTSAMAAAGWPSRLGALAG